MVAQLDIIGADERAAGLNITLNFPKLSALRVLLQSENKCVRNILAPKSKKVSAFLMIQQTAYCSPNTKCNAYIMQTAATTTVTTTVTNSTTIH